MVTSQTMPYDTTTSSEAGQDIQRSSSGGFFAQRKRSTDEKRLLSALRAADLMTQYEMADEEAKEETLIRKADFISIKMTSLGAGLGNAQRALAQAQKAKNGAELKNHGLTEENNESLGRTKASNLMSEFDSVEHREDTLNRSGPFSKVTTPTSRYSISGRGLHNVNFGGTDQSIGEQEVLRRTRSTETPLSLPSLHDLKSRSFDGDVTKPVTKTRAQQRIDKALATRMRILSEMPDNEPPSEVAVHVTPLLEKDYSYVNGTTEDNLSSPH